MVDTHCHLTAPPYDGERDAVLGRARTAGVRAIVGIASDLGDAARAIELARDSTARARDGGWPRIFATAGIHPHEVGALVESAGKDSAAAGDASFWRDVRSHLRTLCDEPEVRAIGECGLDFHYDFTPAEVQERWFDRQLELAQELGRPVVVHCREAEARMIPRVREAGEAGVRGVLHCFPGDMALLEVAMQAGWCVSFTGMITFRSFTGTDAVRAVPDDRYFIETDGPYLAPVPHRGRRNEPSYVVHVAERVAELRGLAPEEVTRETTRNARRFFDLPELPDLPTIPDPG